MRYRFPYETLLSRNSTGWKSRSDVSLGLRLSALTRLFVCFSIVSLGCGGTKAPKSNPGVAVQEVRVTRSEIQQQVTSDAVLYPLHQAVIVPKISAPVLKFYVRRGDRVRAGELLAVLANSDLVAAVDESKGAYEQALAHYQSISAANLPDQIQKAKANVESSQTSYKAAREFYESSKNLYAQGALSERQLNEAEVGSIRALTQLQTAEENLGKLQSVGQQAQLHEAQGEVAAAKGKYDSAQAEVAFSRIHSPIDGVVTDRPLYEGQMANSGAPLMTIMDLSQVVARAHIPEPEAVALKVGDSARITVPGEKMPLPGKVIVVSPALDPDSTTLEVWIEAPNPMDRLKPGTTVSVTAIAKTVPDALVIPESALLSQSDDTGFVMVIDSDHAVCRTKVQTGLKEGDRVQITAGLTEGELIAGEGGYGLPDGTKVTY